MECAQVDHRTRWTPMNTRSHHYQTKQVCAQCPVWLHDAASDYGSHSPQKATRDGQRVRPDRTGTRKQHEVRIMESGGHRLDPQHCQIQKLYTSPLAMLQVVSFFESLEQKRRLDERAPTVGTAMKSCNVLFLFREATFVSSCLFVR